MTAPAKDRGMLIYLYENNSNLGTDEQSALDLKNLRMGCWESQAVREREIFLCAKNNLWL